MVNKRGQDLPIGALILIVLGVIVLLLLVLGFTTGFDFIFDKFKVAPGQDLEAVAQSCNFAAQGNLRIDFCDFKEVTYQGVKQYVNCEDSRVKGSITAENSISCKDLTDASGYCTIKKLKPDVLVNNVKCNTLNPLPAQ